MVSKPITNWDDVPVIFDVPFASRLLGFKPDRVMRLAKDGKIPAHKTAKEWRFLKQEIKQYIESC